ncbi:hypothetical protein LTR64_000733 [Lithohypha guttulata]|uniref:uncharacterized protein n=1 Tax=Lithohypha guttulata TaxID=1690604 RepID=UPI002DE10E24|nr:hypothetical protein LTR51_005498 [Lithohypha guttulata]
MDSSERSEHTEPSDPVTQLQLTPELREIHDKVLRTVRCLVADLCQQYDGGHPGSAMGMAALGLALYKYVMCYSPGNPRYFNRDRLVLSNGHACLWQYVYMHVVGFPTMTMEHLRSYHSSDRGSICPGHPEIQFDGIEVSTGPLGQGVGNAVGLAIASRHLSATYNKPHHNVLDHMIWCVVGDGCLQEGVSLEAIQLAGHWKLDNLAILYDNNGVTCAGTVDLTTSEDVNARMEACGWQVVDVVDGVDNISRLVEVLLYAQHNRQKPTFVNVRTIIGYGAWFQGKNEAHGNPLGVDGVANLKRQLGMNPKTHFHIDEDVYRFFADVGPAGRAREARFAKEVKAYGQSYPVLAQEFVERMEGRWNTHWQHLLPAKKDLPSSKVASRVSAGEIIALLAQHLPQVMVTSCDLQPTTNMSWPTSKAFQCPVHDTTSGTTSGDYTGRYLHCGVREHAMAAIANGLAAFNAGTVLPFTSAFLMFYGYAVPAVRMGALQGLRIIHLATHDSIAIGYDGPTHQPVEIASLFRAMPNLLYIRPCDGEETCGAFMVAVAAEKASSVISLSRHGLVQYPQYSSRGGVGRGAYVFIEELKADITLIGVGSEMVFAVEARKKLAERGFKARIVSFPCQRLFEAESRQYRETVMQYDQNKPVVIIEAYAVNGWERYADAGYSMHTFGKSLPPEDQVYEFFGFEANCIASKLQDLIAEVNQSGIRSLRGDFRDLNVRFV